ncbi:hypothetical protein FS749_009000 [Ceratobasidium sp. UAMH 11750]|nr:hypothetical protein FS749_009000 [Ceratobasidium sp. UAMH 11750]
MSHSLSTEILTRIASFASTATLAALARVSSTTDAIAMQSLYTSIPPMHPARVILCLRTLAQHPDLANLVRSYNIIIIEDAPLVPNFSYDFSLFAPRAFKHMTNLTELLLCLGDFTNSSIFAHATFNLRHLTCFKLSSHRTYTTAQFLASQPTIESLVIKCDLRDIKFGLPRDALPILRSVSAPFTLLPPLLHSRLSHVTRISTLDSSVTGVEIFLLAIVFSKALVKPASDASIELGIGLDLRYYAARTYNAIALAYLGSQAPWVESLRLVIHRGCVDRELLLGPLKFALAKFPELHTLSITFSLPHDRAYIHPQPTRDTLYDSTDLDSCFAELHAVCPSLEWVVLPIGTYTCAKVAVKGAKRTREGQDEVYWRKRPRVSGLGGDK